LNAREARYLIVGAHAVAFHAQPRATKDLDLLIDPSVDNARRVLEAMSDFGLADLLRTKEAAGRDQDRADAAVLRRVGG
jgi:hypothetical protein